MGLIVALIAFMNDKPLSEWTLPIQPNSLLAVLTTIAKTSMMVPIASCIGQLKWRHFTLRPRSLRHLQIFDDASRGPWGSAVLAYRFAFRVRAFVALGLALVSILALGIDPSAQQILSVAIRQTNIASSAVKMGKAEGIFSLMWDASIFRAAPTPGLKRRKPRLPRWWFFRPMILTHAPRDCGRGQHE